MMRHYCFGILVLLALTPAAMSQSPDAYHKFEVYGGYVYAKQAPNSGEEFYVEGKDHFSIKPCTVDGLDFLGTSLQRIFCQRRGFNGFDASATYNFKKYLGIKGNFTALFKPDKTVDHFDTHTDTNTFKDRTYEFLGGLQIKNNSKTLRFKPFLHVLAGFARQTSHDVQTSTGPFNFTLDDRVTSFAMKIGAGADLRLSPKIDLRLIEVNYNPIFARRRHVTGNADFDLTLGGHRADNVTIGVGIVIH